VKGQGIQHDNNRHRQPEGRLGKTTLSVNLAAAAEATGAVALIIDTDPQATASQWGAWRADKALR
jgi:chromosome partitioning protein